VLGTPPALILSQDQTLKLKWSASALAGLSETRLTRAPVDDMALHVVQFVKLKVVRSRPPVVNYTPDTRKTLRHPLILDGLCLHVLSSFQRTGLARAPRQLFRRQGNLAILLATPDPVNPFAHGEQNFVPAGRLASLLAGATNATASPTSHPKSIGLCRSSAGHGAHAGRGGGLRA
jgi:hypothetical protein